MRRWLDVLGLFVTCCVGFVRYELWDGEGDSELCGVFGPVQDHLPEDCLFGLQVSWEGFVKAADESPRWFACISGL